MGTVSSLVTLPLPLLLQLIGVTFAVQIDPYIRKEQRRIMLLIVALLLSLIVQDCLGSWLDVDGTKPFARTIVGIYGYSVRPLVIVLFFYIVGKRRKLWPAWLLIGLNTLIHLTAVFSPICFCIDADNHFCRGPLGYSCHIVSGILLAYLVLITVREYSRARKSETWIALFNAALIIASVVLDSLVDYREYCISFLTIAMVSSCVFYYIWLHLQFVREHEQALMAEQRIQIMMSQIQPHFLYNTLSTIQALCRLDPEKAFTTTEKFGTYLRQNIDSLGQPHLIPLEKELEHTRIYAEIENIRFPYIHVEYDIQDRDFSVPALTIQPLVENAIRHGVRVRENGQVTVTTRKTAEAHEIVIRDNGRGFDVENTVSTGETHIGIRNVRERLERMCGGTLAVQSRIGEGTVVTICIPAGKDRT